MIMIIICTKWYTSADSHKGNIMKTVILTIILTVAALNAEDVVHYDTRDTKTSSMSKPNHPNTDLHRWEFDSSINS